MILAFIVTGALAVPVADGLVTVPALNLIVGRLLSLRDCSARISSFFCSSVEERLSLGYFRQPHFIEK